MLTYGTSASRRPPRKNGLAVAAGNHLEVAGLGAGAGELDADADGGAQDRGRRARSPGARECWTAHWSCRAPSAERPRPPSGQGAGRSGSSSAEPPNPGIALQGGQHRRAQRGCRPAGTARCHRIRLSPTRIVVTAGRGAPRAVDLGVLRRPSRRENTERTCRYPMVCSWAQFVVVIGQRERGQRVATAEAGPVRVVGRDAGVQVLQHRVPVRQSLELPRSKARSPVIIRLITVRI